MLLLLASMVTNAPKSSATSSPPNLSISCPTSASDGLSPNVHSACRSSAASSAPLSSASNASKAECSRITSALENCVCGLRSPSGAAAVAGEEGEAAAAAAPVLAPERSLSRTRKEK
jgi:hypothetical protein